MSALDAPVTVTLRGSRRIGAALLCIGAGALLGLSLAQIPLWLKLVLAFAVLGDLRRRILLHAALRGAAVRELTLQRGGQWRLRTADGKELDAALLPGCLVLPQLTVLCFRGRDGRRATAILVSSNCEKDAFRRLRVRLRWQGVAEGP